MELIIRLTKSEEQTLEELKQIFALDSLVSAIRLLIQQRK